MSWWDQMTSWAVAHFSGFQFQVTQDFSGGVAAGRAHDAAAGMGGGAAEIQAGHLASGIARSRAPGG